MLYPFPKHSKPTFGTPFFRIVLLGLFTLLYSMVTNAQNQPGITSVKAAARRPIRLNPVVNNAFGKGEKVTYRVHYGWLTAGEATMKIANEDITYNNRNCYRIEVTGISSGLIKQITTINDVWGAVVDSAAIMPHKFYRNINENSYHKSEEITFDYNEGKANVYASRRPTGELTIQDNTLDMVTGYFYLRLLNYDAMEPETMISLNGIYEDKTYNIKIRYKGKERIKTEFGYINAIRLQPVMPENGVFAGENSVKFYISDDENRIPLKIRAELFVGAVELDISTYQNLKHPIVFNKKK
jgi:hypothetical protein